MSGIASTIIEKPEHQRKGCDRGARGIILSGLRWHLTKLYHFTARRVAFRHEAEIL